MVSTVVQTELLLVTVGEECWASELVELHCSYHRQVFSLVSKCGGHVWLRPLGAESTDKDVHIASYDKVQPLRLVQKETYYASKA